MDESKVVRTLLVEDDPDDVLFMQMYLSAFGQDALRFELQVAERLETGLVLLAGGAFDIVLLDLMLPDSSGLETFLRVMASRPDAAILVLTGLNDEKAALEAVSLGAQDYLYKGALNEGLLKKAILYAIERRRLVSHLEGIIAGAADGMVVVDAGSVVRYLNPAAERLFGARSPDMLGRSFPHPTPGPGETREVRLPAADGPARAVEMRVTGIEWKKDAARLVSLRDVTQLQKLEQLKAEIKERRKMETVKDEFFTAVSHELRSPLTIALAAISSLRAGSPGPLNPKQTEIVRIAYRSLKRLVRFVKNILDLAGLESGRTEPRRRALNLRLLIRDAVAGFELASGESVAVACELPPELPPVQADPDMVAEVLGNLLENALRYARSVVTVSAAVADAVSPPREAAPAASGAAYAVVVLRWVQVTVADDGPGIPPEEIAALFDRYARAKLRADAKGMGIGLALCREIVERHGGRIWAESPPGGGARLHFALPEKQG